MARTESGKIRVSGARDHNLKNVSLTLPKNELICFTGVSGSGKSSMAFDTLYAEGQRRYVESLSSYARQFMGQLPKPDVDQITGLAPAIAIQQKAGGWNPRSTVGTITQIHDYARVLFARAGTQHCTQCGQPITAQTREQMLARMLSLADGTRFNLLAPKIRGQKGEYKDLFADLLRDGFVRARVDGRIVDLSDPPPLDRYRRHNIEVVIDRLVLKPGIRTRLADALDTALSLGEGTAILDLAAADDRGQGSREMLFSSDYACTRCGLGFEPPIPQMLSFNSPQGMCLHCDGLGMRYDFDPELLIPDPKRSFLDPCIAAFRNRPGKWRRHIYEGVARHVGFDLAAAWDDLSDQARQALLWGTGQEHITFEWKSRQGTWKHGDRFDGVIAELNAKHKRSGSTMVRKFYEQFMRQSTCTHCGGARLNSQSLAIRMKSSVGGRDAAALNIHEVCCMSIRAALEFFDGLELDATGRLIATEPLKEIRARLGFLLEVGLDYLTLDRTAPTLSGGESQRIRLASQIGCGLVGVLYVLDEPSIGLHPRDNQRLLASLTRLRDMGNTVIVVEHDRDTMLAADCIVDFGPGPGVRGGRIVAQGDLNAITSEDASITGAYLSGRREIPVPRRRRPINRPVKRSAAAVVEPPGQ